LKKLSGRTDVENALRRLEKLTQEEARMATAESLKVTYSIDNKLEDVDARVKDFGNKLIGGTQIIS
jgi:hypothetical protein